MDAIIGFAVTLLAVVIFGIAFSFGRISVMDDCKNYGKAKIDAHIIECKQVQP